MHAHLSIPHPSELFLNLLPSFLVKLDRGGGIVCNGTRWLHKRRDTQINIPSKGKAAVQSHLQWSGRAQGRVPQKTSLSVQQDGSVQAVLTAALGSRSWVPWMSPPPTHNKMFQHPITLLKITRLKSRGSLLKRQFSYHIAVQQSWEHAVTPAADTSCLVSLTPMLQQQWGTALCTNLEQNKQNSGLEEEGMPVF